MKDIYDLCCSNNINDIIKYGDYIAKVNPTKKDENGKLVLVTAISPTKYGEGKTTVLIGLVDALNRLNKSCCGVLREPSLGPVFGVKGGATGGGKSIILPEEDINLHFTGDFHAITSANNLIAAAIDNHIYFGNDLGIETKCFKRCIDMNDRYLRDDFKITAASEIMTILCLSKDIDDLKRRIGNIIIGYRKDGSIILAKELKVENACSLLLKDAIKPNIVQTLENNLVYVHGGPFANISIGTSSLISIKEGLKNFDLTVTEAGFGSDLGATKFIDILSKQNNIKPNCVVLVVTNKAIKVNGLENIDAHINILNNLGVKTVVAINKFSDDKLEDIKFITDYLDKINIPYSITSSFNDGSSGSLDLANKVLDNLYDVNINDLYNLDDKLEDKIFKLCNKLYKCKNIEYSSLANNKIKYINDNNIKYPICICKTQYSISDDKDKLGYPKDFTMNVKDIEIMNGSEMIVVKFNEIYDLPGLPKEPNFINME